VKSRGFDAQRGWHGRANRAHGRAPHSRENTHVRATGAHDHASLIGRIFWFLVYARKIMIFDPFSPMRAKHLDRPNYTWKQSFTIQNNLIQLTPKWLISQKCLKQLLAQKPDFLPNHFSPKTYWSKTEIPLNSNHHNNSINLLKFIKIKLLHF